jgi:hypothetical protein
MKKVLLSLAVVFVMSSFTTSNTDVEKNTLELFNPVELTTFDYSNEATNSLEEFGTCAITITATNQDGEIVSQNTFYLEAYSEIHCAQLAGAFRRFLERQ